MPKKKGPEENMVKLQAKVSKAPCIGKSSAHFVPAKAEKAGSWHLESKPSLSAFRKPARRAPKCRANAANPRQKQRRSRTIASGRNLYASEE